MTSAGPASAAPVRLLWTGGWDSTYRLLDLLLVQGCSVQPYYVKLRRKSAAVEWRTMAHIRERLTAQYPALCERLLEVQLIEAPSEDAELLASYLALRETSGSRAPGGQLYWLAAAAKAHGLAPIEIGVHAEPGAAWYELLRRNVERSGETWSLPADPEIAELAVFSPFEFPLLALSKLEMAERSRRAGFADLLELSWFCYAPDARGRACGLCPPCRQTIAAGLGRRIPPARRLKSLLLSPLASVLRKYRVRRRLRDAAAAIGSVLRRKPV